MANPEHLEILQQGVEVWNEWRIEHDKIVPDLDDADFSGTDLSGTDFSGTNFAGAHLRNVDFTNAELTNVTLNHADLTNTIIVGADLTDSDLRNVNFTNVVIGYTMFGDNDLSQVKGLETIEHIFPSYLTINTIYKSRGKIPEVFLRGCGVPENFITYMHSLTEKGLEFYKCFISFTEADDMFSERLYSDLQGKGVRCWRWKEDAKWGKSLMSSIDEAVRYYDKLVVICSEHSLNSPAVIREIERALQKEDELARQGKDSEVLFPIRLDDYIFTGWGHYRKADVIAKNVGDFRRWNEPEQYKKAFERLLRDLKAEEKKESQTAEG
jgi:hypothetical protein